MKLRKISFHNVKLSNKLLIMYFFAVFIPIVLTNITFYHVTIENVKKQQMQDSKLALQQITNNFGRIVDEAVGISSSLYTNSNINSFLEKDFITDIDYIDDYNTYIRTFNQSSPINPSINSIRFFTDNPTMIYSGGVYLITKEIKQLEWYKQVSLGRTTGPIMIHSPASIDSRTFAVIRKLDYFNFNNKEKIVRIEINPANIKQIFENVTFKGDLFLLNDEGEIEYSTKKGLNWLKKPLKYNQISYPDNTVTINTKIKDRTYLHNWKVVGAISEKTMLETVNDSGRFIILLACINLLLPTVIIIIIARSFLMRLHRVLKHVKRMKNQDFEIIDGQEFKDEIGQLTIEYNRMSKKIKELIHDVFLANIQKKDLEIKRNRAQLSALQSQINPHFLFNALETIRMRSVIKQEMETANIIHNMAKIFRNSLTWGKDMVTVQAEVKLINSFLEIQKYRFGDKLDYKINVDDVALDRWIPNMSFLPFIENASIHGIEPLADDGKITINISLNNGLLTCIVMDNGAGMTIDKRNQLLSSLEKEEEIGENVGIKNVFYRLKLYYGNQFDFELESKENKGTKITIKVPEKLKGKFVATEDREKKLYFIK
ncbi:sensor histidine kinase [Neobacillus sp. YX16]|uniref:sensor histidine kinase n=1 Tax=Neobacillus sp. YX16 TaxID=3047874 RepID=UPI0024C3D019|nr:sensor histidine kinase [Neobacillus sp. YX16]WHZ05093.1 sensor histidine kinase [Neobacillus sp. YX16]